MFARTLTLPQMNTQIDIIQKPRLQLLTIIDDLSLDQLNTIPTGFNNNVIWNMGHIIAAQQGICYMHAGLPLCIDESFFLNYKPGTKPERIYTADDLALIKELFFSTLNQLEADLKTNMFGNYTPFVTRYGFEITGIDDAVSFLPFHEGLHIGTVVALKKLV
jgi:hypothetical protein